MNLQEQLLEINILISGPFLGRQAITELLCLKCDHKWEGVPSTRLAAFKKSGSGCPKCQQAILLQSRNKELTDRLNPFSLQIISFNGNVTDHHDFICTKCNKTGNCTVKNMYRKLDDGRNCALFCRDVVQENISKFKQTLTSRNSVSECKLTCNFADYVGNSSKMTFICNNQHSWFTTPEIAKNPKHSCPECIGQVRLSPALLQQRVAVLNRSREPQIILQDIPSKLTIETKLFVKCQEGHQWEPCVRNILQGHHCSHCAGNAKKTPQQFAEEAQKNNKIVLVDPSSEYKSMSRGNKLSVQCVTCNYRWSMSPQNILAGYGCPYCSKNQTQSAVASKWLASIENQLGYKIQHADNGGEFRIPETKYRVDGYDVKTNTIYEFYGDYWHGNPKTNDLNATNEIVNKTFGELYESTMTREQEIKDLGYNLASVWESDVC